MLFFIHKKNLTTLLVSAPIHKLAETNLVLSFGVMSLTKFSPKLKTGKLLCRLGVMTTLWSYLSVLLSD